MPEGVAEVQQGPIAALPFIPSNDLCLDLTGTADGMRQRLRLTRQQSIDIQLQLVEKGRIVD